MYDGKADLSMAAMRAVEFSCDMSIYYERKLGNRPNDKDVKRKALNAVKFQLIKMMFAVVRQDRVFEQRGLDKA